MIKSGTLDHLIVAVADLDMAEKNYSTIFGANPGMERRACRIWGTWMSENSLFNFNNTYFELLAAKGDGIKLLI